MPGAIVGPAQPGPSGPPRLSAETVAQLVERCSAAGRALRQKAQYLEMLQKQGKLPEYQTQVQTFESDMKKFTKFKLFVARAQDIQKQQQQGRAPGPGAGGQGQGQGQVQGNNPQTQANQAGPSNAPGNMMDTQGQFNNVGQMTAGAGQSQSQSPAQAQAQALMQGQMQNTQLMPNLPPNMNPQMMAQVQKMLEQRNRAPHIQPAPMPPVAGPSQVQVQRQPQEQPGTVAPGQVANAAGQQQKMWWRGYLRWSGTDPSTGAKKEIFTHVFMRGANPSQDMNLMYVFTAIRSNA